MPTYIITAPDGKELEITAPEGATQEQVLAYAQSQYTGQPAAPAAPVSQPAPQAAAPAEEVSLVSRMFGLSSPLARTVKGAVVDPLMGLNQVLANALPFPQGIKQAANQNVRAIDQAVEAERARIGSTGFDPYQLLGNVVSPTNLLPSALASKVTGLLSSGAAAGVKAAPAVARSVAAGTTAAALTPVTSADQNYASDKLTQMAVGAVLGPAVEGVVVGGSKAVGKLLDIVKGLTPAGREAALRTHLNTLAGPDKEKVITALREATELVTGSRPTAAEALANLPSATELAAAQAKIAKKPGISALFAERSAEQQAARARVLQEIAGTPAERAALEAERGTVTGAMRETALDQSNVAGPLVSRLRKEISDGFNSIAAATETAGMTGLAASRARATAEAGKPGFLTAGTIAEEAAGRSAAYTGKAETIRKNVALKKYQLDSLEQNGFFPLRASDIVDRIDAAMKGTVSDQSKAVLAGVREKILSKADENGIIDSRDLYENVRKTLNQDIATYLNLGQNYASGGLPEQAAKTAGNVKKFIDSALDQSSEGLWSKYLTSYQDYSTRLNRMEIGDFLSKQLNTSLDKERAGVFATAVDNAAATIKKSTGFPRYNKLSDVLTGPEVASVNNVLADLNRLAKSKDLASRTSPVTEGQVKLADEIPNLLSRTVSLLKAGIEHLQRGNAKEFNNQMAQLMLEPGALAKFMSENVPKSRVNSFTSSLMTMMDDTNRSMFIQAFTVPTVSQELGQ